jgi:hypothetical protein
MSASSDGTARNFDITLFGSSGSINLFSGSAGTIDNFNIGENFPGRGTFSSLFSTGSLIVTHDLNVDGNTSMGGSITVGGNVNFLGSGHLKIPVGTTAQRPSPSEIGMIRYNTDIENFEGYDGEKWRSIGEEGSDDYGDLSGSITVILDYRFINETVDTALDYGNLF